MHLDTHVLLWLSQGKARVLGDEAFRLAGRETWIVSPAVLLELEILREIGRIKKTPEEIVSAAREIGDFTSSRATYTEVVQAARDLAWTRDPIDRLVTAHAIADGARLLTADETIRANFKDAVWD